MTAWFRRGQPEPTDLNADLRVPTALMHLDDVPYARRTVAEFAEKPAELVRATEWSRPAVQAESAPLLWSLDVPIVPGTYRYMNPGSTEQHSCSVVEFGAGHLAVVSRKEGSDAALYRSVTTFPGRRWARKEEDGADG